MAWMVILLASAGWIAVHRMESDAAAPGGQPARVTAINELTARMVLAGRSMGGTSGVSPGVFLKQAEPLKEGSSVERIAYAILAAEVDGPEAGLELIDAIRAADDVPQADRELAAAVHERMVAWQDGKPVAERTLEAADAERLGVFAEVLAGKAQPATGILVVLGGVVAWYVVMGLGGFIGLVVLLVFLGLGSRRGFGERSPRGLLYAETFALWMVLFFGGNLVVGAILAELGWNQLAAAMNPIIFFGSLVALGWPVVRGATWSDVRRDIGWTVDGSILRSIMTGLAAYAMSLPLMGAGAILFMLLSHLSGTTPQPSHPAVEGIAESTLPRLITLFLLACVAAPIVEETMFRGVLYRHLRDATSFLGALVSVLAATLLSSVLFAAIHPQGFFFIPVLGGLATGFCLAREWRGSLLPGMVAHGLTNFVTLGLNIVLGLV